MADQNASGGPKGELECYQKYVKQITEKMPTFKPLHDFLEEPEKKHHKLRCSITIIKFSKDNAPWTEISIGLQKGAADYDKNLKTLQGVLKEEGTPRLLLVENITPAVLTLLGSEWKVSPEYFCSHLENSNWYEEQNIAEHLPALRSVPQGYLRFQFIGAREFKDNVLPPSVRKSFRSPTEASRVLSPLKIWRID
jgi:hypothetical protein